MCSSWKFASHTLYHRISAFMCAYGIFFFYPESVSLLNVVAYETALPSEKATHLQRFKGNGLLRGAGGALCMLER